MHGSATPDVGGDLPFHKIRKKERKTWRPWETKPSVWFNGLRTPLVLISLSILLLHILALSALEFALYTSLQLRHPAPLHSRNPSSLLAINFAFPVSRIAPMLDHIHNEYCRY
jgi:hypothetical protein